MAQHSAAVDWAIWAFSPTISAIIVTLLVSICLPIILHFYLYRTTASAALPTFLLLGPSGAGKTTILTLVGVASNAVGHSILLTIGSVASERKVLTDTDKSGDSSSSLPTTWLSDVVRRSVSIRK